MASIFRIGIPKVVSGGLTPRLCKVSKSHNVVQVAFITRKSRLVLDRQLPKPFPYWRKDYTLFQQLIDPMMYRFYENSKIIVIDGPPSIGKTKVCEKVADEFGMLYMPAPTHDEYYINTYGFDLRQLDTKLPPNCQSVDLQKYLANPKDPKIAFFQNTFFQMRFEQYVNGLLHLLSTGQGIVLNRWFYSEIGFAQAMRNAGHISQQAFDLYKHMRGIAVNQILRPHLTIYLDVPVDLVKEKIKNGGTPQERDSKVFTTQYLSDLEKTYKEKYLKDISSHAHVLMYDWSKEGNVMDIVEEIEELDFEGIFDEGTSKVYKGKNSDWAFTSVCDLRNMRAECSDLLTMYLKIIEPNDFDIPDELIYSADDIGAMSEVLENEPTEKYEKNYNPDAGDKIFWKTDIPDPLYNLRRTPRDFVNREKYMT